MNSILRGAVTSRRFVFAAVTVILLILFYNAIPAGYLGADDVPKQGGGGTTPPQKPKPAPENAAPSSKLSLSPSSLPSSSATPFPYSSPLISLETSSPSPSATPLPLSSAAAILSSVAETKPSSTPVSQKPDNELTKAAILASLKTEDTTWLEHSPWPDNNMTNYVYIVDDPTAALTVPKNKGHEAMVYLTYIIDHYDALPDTMLFLHAHRWAWHNPDLLGSDAAEIIHRLSPPYVQRMGYVNVRCHWDPGCPEWMHPLKPETERTDVYKPEELELAKAFQEIFPGEEVPEVLAQPCCAQFALSGDFARKISLDRYRQVRQWVLDTTLDDAISGRIWEYLWQYLFTGAPKACPRMDLCYCDGFGVCFGGEAKSNDWFDIRNEQRKLQAAHRDIVDPKEGEEEAPVLTEGEKQIVKELETQIKEFQDQLDQKLRAAKTRGDNPKLRAEDCGREWKEGDGF